MIRMRSRRPEGTLWMCGCESTECRTGVDELVLHPIQRQSVDTRLSSLIVNAESKRLEIPARTAAVLVEPRISEKDLASLPLFGKFV